LTVDGLVLSLVAGLEGSQFNQEKKLMNVEFSRGGL